MPKKCLEKAESKNLKKLKSNYYNFTNLKSKFRNFAMATKCKLIDVHINSH